jgi:hypothetical protein
LQRHSDELNPWRFDLQTTSFPTIEMTERLKRLIQRCINKLGYRISRIPKWYRELSVIRQWNNGRYTRIWNWKSNR